MASTTSLKLQSAPAPPPPAKPAHHGRRNKWLGLAVLLALIAGAVVAFVAIRRAQERARRAAAAPTVVYAPVTRGTLVRSLRVGGTVSAVHYAMVAAPALRGGNFGQLTIVSLAEAGTHVKAGDLLAEFDRQQQRNNFEDHQAQYISAIDKRAKRAAELEVEKETRKTDLRKALNDLAAAQLENRRNEVLSKIDSEKNQLALSEAEANLKMLQQTQKLRDEAATAELKLLDIQGERERLDMEHARYNYERMQVRSPISGLVVLQNIWKGGNMGPVQVGDQVRPGLPFLQVVDSTQMVVRSRVNQLDAALLRPTAPVRVHLDAYSDVDLAGKVQTVATLAQSNSWRGQVKSFSVVFEVDGADARLMPDISASVDIVVQEEPNALLVPRGAVVRQAGSRDQGFVWVQQGASEVARAVTLGAYNDTHWAIVSGVSEGDRVALTPPAGFHPNTPSGNESAPAKTAAATTRQTAQASGPPGTAPWRKPNQEGRDAATGDN